MWYVEYQYADGCDETYKWVGLTKEQSYDLHKQLSGRKDTFLTKYVRSGLMEYN